MGQKTDNSERRQSIRFDRDDIVVRLFDDSQELRDVSLRDIGRGGFGVYLGKKLKPGQVLRFRISLPGGTVSGSGTVIWNGAHHLGFRSGLKFLNLGWFQKHRLKRFLKPYENDLGGSASSLPSINLDKLLDSALRAGVVLIAAACAAEYFGIDILGFLGF